MLNKNLDINTLNKQVLLNKPKIIANQKGLDWRTESYVFVTPTGTVDGTPTSFYDFSSASEITLIFNSNLTEDVVLRRVQVYSNATGELLYVLDLAEYYPLDTLIIKAGQRFVFGSAQTKGLGDVDVFSGLAEQVVFTLSRASVDKTPEVGSTFDLMILGRR